MEIRRDTYLNILKSKMDNGRIKIITGIRCCGKSYLLFPLFKDYLLSQGVKAEQIIEIKLDRQEFTSLRNPNLLYEFILSKIADEKSSIIVDEVQLSHKVKNEDIDEKLWSEEDRYLINTTFYEVLSDLMARPNLNIYVTESNSKLLSKDVATKVLNRQIFHQVVNCRIWSWYTVCI